MYVVAELLCEEFVRAMKTSQKTDHHSKRKPPGVSIASWVSSICDMKHEWESFKISKRESKPLQSFHCACASDWAITPKYACSLAERSRTKRKTLKIWVTQDVQLTESSARQRSLSAPSRPVEMHQQSSGTFACVGSRTRIDLVAARDCKSCLSAPAVETSSVETSLERCPCPVTFADSFPVEKYFVETCFAATFPGAYPAAFLAVTWPAAYPAAKGLAVTFHVEQRPVGTCLVETSHFPTTFTMISRPNFWVCKRA